MKSFVDRGLATVVACLALTAAAGAGVKIVNSAGPGDFADLPPAVAAANDGDVLLVKSGNYSGFQVANKALDIVANTTGSVVVQGTVSVSGLAVTRCTTLSGLTIQSAPLTEGLTLRNCAGAVRVQGCVVQPQRAPDCIVSGATHHALVVLNCTDVCIARCTIEGAQGNETATGVWYGGIALWLEASRCALYECTVLGGRGGDLNAACGPVVYGYAGYGGPGLWSQNAPLVFASGCLVRGGDGGDVHSFPGEAGCGYEGWVTNNFLGGTFIGRRLDTVVGGGARGLPPIVFCHDVAPPFLGPPPTVVAGPARELSAARVVREHADLRFTVHGLPGENVELVIGERTDFTFSDAWHGVRLLPWKPAPLAVLPLGLLPGTGELQVAIPLGELGPGIASRRLFLQAKHDGNGSGIYLGAPATVVVLDSAY